MVIGDWLVAAGRAQVDLETTGVCWERVFNPSDGHLAGRESVAGRLDDLGILFDPASPLFFIWPTEHE